MIRIEIQNSTWKGFKGIQDCLKLGPELEGFKRQLSTRISPIDSEHARELGKKAGKKRTAKANAPCGCCGLTRNQYWHEKRSQLGLPFLEKSPDRLADEATAEHFEIEYESMKKFRYKEIKSLNWEVAKGAKQKGIFRSDVK